MFVEAIDNFSIAVFLTNSRVTTLPVESYSYIRDYDDPTVAAIAVLLMAMPKYWVATSSSWCAPGRRRST